MASSKAKGDKQERLAVKELEKDGYVIFKSPRTMRMVYTPRGPMYVSQDNDVYNLYDLIAKSHGITRWIQVKYGDITNVSRSKKPIAEFHDKHMSITENSEIWFKPIRGRFFIKYFYNSKTKEWVCNDSV
jgi:Holliday junction resolvase-like predicted endonuclease